ncbi:MAG: DUF2752 domain-containing protein [Bacteroidaceae bacterium]|nr:DUF2752 domain-containing protein [Bacteroidaceae bacterium]
MKIRRNIPRILIPVAILVAGIFYYVVNPTTVSPFIPKCVWRLLTGTQCPACGFQRAVHSVLHGHFIEALSYNYFFILSIPFFLLVLLSDCILPSNNSLRRFTHHRYTLYTYIFLFFAWWILRNVWNV